MCEKSRPWYTVEGLSTSYQANPGKRICDTFFLYQIQKKKKRVSMNKTTKLLQGEGWLAKYSLEVRVILLQGTTFHLVNRLVDKGAVDNVSSPKKK